MVGPGSDGPRNDVNAYVQEYARPLARHGAAALALAGGRQNG
jgi:hypothetical protein